MNIRKSEVFVENGIRFLVRTLPLVEPVDISPSHIVALATRGYTGRFDTAMSDEDEEEFWRELGSTKLKTPLEFARATFLISDVTRAFTHQMVRYRLASIVQESMRFSVQTTPDSPGNTATVRIPREIADYPSQRRLFVDQTCKSFEAYWSIIARGGNVEDARAMLPMATCTRLFISLPVSSWADIYSQRMCCQAQGEEWIPVMVQVADCLVEASPHYAGVMLKPWETGAPSCGFGASFDRPCKFQTSFDRNVEKLTSGK